MRHIFIGFVLLFLGISCGNKNTKDTATSDALDAFGKIDDKAKTAFTYSDRKNAYANSLVKSSENQKSDLNKATSYSGYGSNQKNRNKKVSEEKRKNKETKKVYYNKKPKKVDQQFSYSAYDTN